MRFERGNENIIIDHVGERGVEEDIRRYSDRFSTDMHETPGKSFGLKFIPKSVSESIQVNSKKVFNLV